MDRYLTRNLLNELHRDVLGSSVRADLASLRLYIHPNFVWTYINPYLTFGLVFLCQVLGAEKMISKGSYVWQLQF